MGNKFSRGRRNDRGVTSSNLLSSPVLNDGHTSMSALVNVSQDGSDFKLLKGVMGSKRLHQQSAATNQKLLHNNGHRMAEQQNLVDLDDHNMLIHFNSSHPLSGQSTNNNPMSQNGQNNDQDSLFNHQQGAVGKIYVALYDWEDTTTAEELSIKKGEKLEILDDSNPEWLLARPVHRNNKKSGYVPRNYVAEWNSLGAELWYFGKMKRIEAENRLLMPDNQKGSFIVRNSESRKKDYSLSVRDYSPKEGTSQCVVSVKHYRIRRTQDGLGYYIATRRVFQSIQELVAHYMCDADGLCVTLTASCKRSERPILQGLSYETYDKWEIDRKSLTLIRELGHGQFGKVFEGLWNNKTRVAIKTLREGSMDPQDFLAEAQIMKGMTHPNLVQLYAVCTKEEPIFIITELMSNGALLEYLQKTLESGKQLDIKQKIDMARQIASGMEYLERHNYVHRDLAARNILVGDNNNCKIADFGLARLIKDSEYEARAGSRFPIKWTAPEAANYSKFSIKSDVWSFGIVLYEIIANGRVPYPSMSNADVLSEIERGYRMKQPEGCPNKLYEMMQNCWHKDPNKRPTFETLHWQLEDFFNLGDSEYRDANQYRAR